MSKNAILIVSFGTSHEETRKKTIEEIERDCREAFPHVEHRRAFTSGMVMKILRDRDGVHIPDVEEAMEELVKDGYDNIVVQPTHILNGDEYDKMVRQAKKFEDQLESLKIGAPFSPPAVTMKPCAKVSPGKREDRMKKLSSSWDTEPAIIPMRPMLPWNIDFVRLATRMCSLVRWKAILTSMFCSKRWRNTDPRRWSSCLSWWLRVITQRTIWREKRTPGSRHLQMRAMKPHVFSRASASFRRCANSMWIICGKRWLKWKSSCDRDIPPGLAPRRPQEALSHFC